MYYKPLILILVLVFLGSCSAGKKVYQIIDIPEMSASPCEDFNYKNGMVQLKTGRAEEAIRLISSSSCPDDVKNVGLGYAYMTMKRSDMAEESFKKALEVNPENIDASVGLAKIYEEKGDKKQAWHTYSSILTREPENREAKEKFVLLSSSGKEEKLKEAQNYFDKGEQDKYIEALEEAAAYSADDPELLKRIADYFFENQNYTSALKYFEKLRDIDGEDSVIDQLAVCYENTDKIDAAIILYSRQLQKNPGSIELQNKINELKARFVDTELPNQFKDIFFKDELNREDLAILIGHYFENYLDLNNRPVIITDINRTFSRNYIIKVCTHGIMQIRPDHSFGGNLKVNKIEFASAMKKLMEVLLKRGDVQFSLNPSEKPAPSDIDEAHRYFQTINFVTGYGIMELDDENRFNASEIMNPVKSLEVIRRILNLIES